MNGINSFGLRNRFNRSTIMASFVESAVSPSADIVSLAASSRLKNGYELGAITDEYSR